MTLIEVMVALAIIVGVVMVAYQYHEMMIMSNRELLLQQENLLTDENQFDQNYVMEF
ncbi:prepilin-type N-terminal cleavage/methylation domain-containing protein [Wohlfahrtiimonas larvae]|nr:prepilin-type N-terminal cleavage/methylation domain-containing protein [Wohlfahrtiimonas larvae]